MKMFLMLNLLQKCYLFVIISKFVICNVWMLGKLTQHGASHHRGTRLIYAPYISQHWYRTRETRAERFFTS